MRKYIYAIANLVRKAGFNLKETENKRVIEMRKEISKIGKIEFKIEQYPDGSWVAESTNIDGIITGGKTTKDISSTIKDAVFTYFEIPPHLCVDTLLRGDNEPVTLTQRVYA
jgi:predicted RNase H-like HicB family nuclease